MIYTYFVWIEFADVRHLYIPLLTNQWVFLSRSSIERKSECKKFDAYVNSLLRNQKVTIAKRLEDLAHVIYDGELKQFGTEKDCPQRKSGQRGGSLN